MKSFSGCLKKIAFSGLLVDVTATDPGLGDMYKHIMVILELRYWPVFDDNLFYIFENERWVLLKRQMTHEVLGYAKHTCMFGDSCGSACSVDVSLVYRFSQTSDLDRFVCKLPRYLCGWRMECCLNSPSENDM